MPRLYTCGNKLIDSSVPYLMLFGQQHAGDPAMRTTTRNVNRELAETIEPRRYQTNASLSQPPTKASRRAVREYVTNVSWRANRMTPAA
jgi:GH15 family glucan-1,4-alpha-glucosidase